VTRLPDPGGGPARVLVLLRPLVTSTPRPDLLEVLFGLSPAEAAVAAPLVAGHSAEEVAAERGVSIGTVRSQIRAVLDKTGAGSLRQLSAMLGALRGLEGEPEQGGAR
jgi:DNA-binding CsgD family transcriptional regulator